MRFGRRAGQQAQGGTGTAKPAHQRAERDADYPRGLGIGYTFKGHQKQGFLLIEWQGFNSSRQFCQGNMARLGGRRGQFGYRVDIDLLAPSMGGTKVVAIKVQQNGEKPGADRSGRPEQAALGNGAFEAILHQVIGQVDIARQRPGIAPQGWYAGFDLVEELVQF